MFCGSLFNLLSVFFGHCVVCPLQLLITPLVSSNFPYLCLKKRRVLSITDFYNRNLLYLFIISDLHFWNIRILSPCSSDGCCRNCSKQNHVIQIVLLYLSITVYFIRPLFIVYHLMFGEMYYDVITSVVVMGTYSFLCLETFTRLGKCETDSKYSNTFKI